MKTAALLCLAAVALIGCTTTTETTTTSTTERTTAATRNGPRPLDDNGTINKSVYTREDIEKTGREGNVADALQTLDPSITAYGNGR